MELELYLINDICVSSTPIEGLKKVKVVTLEIDKFEDYLNKKIIINSTGALVTIPSPEELLFAENFMLKQNQLALEAYLINLEKNILTGGK